MPWQQIVRHIHEDRVIVRSKDGNEYPAGIGYEHLEPDIYKALVSSSDDEDVWAWVEFEDDGPVVNWFRTGDRPTVHPSDLASA